MASYSGPSDSSLADSLDSLAHRRNVSALSLYYRYYYGRRTYELKSVIPPKRSTRFADSQHSYVVKLEKCRTTLHSLIRLSPRLQGTGTPSLHPSFPALRIFKPSKPGFTNTYASTFSLDQLSLLFGNARIFRDT